MKRIILHIFCFIVLFLVSCKQEKTVITTSSETDVTSFYFLSQDSFPSIGSTTFTISHYASQDTGLIINHDSMTYLTPVTKLVPRIQFKATPSSATIITADTSIVLGGSDTLDFSKPLLLRVISSDLKVTKYYRIVVNVHQVDPDLFDWTILCPGVVASGSFSTRGLVVGGRFYLFANDGFNTTVYQSADAKSWDTGSTPAGLPANCRVRELLAADGQFYYCQEGVLYTSTDGVNWSGSDMTGWTYIPQVMLMEFNDSVWMVSRHRSAQTYHLTVRTGDTWRTLPQALPDEWPISDFAVVTFTASSERPRAMIVGGYDTQGNGLNSRWNIEYTQAAGYRYANFAIQRPLRSAILGADIVYYGKLFYLFGGVDDKAEYISQSALYSDDEGLNWYPIDSTHNRLTDVYTARTQTTALVHDSKIYLLGGQSRTETYSDVIQGKLMSIDW